MFKKDNTLKLVTARKPYRCDITKKEIKVGEKYWRVNLKGVCIFHFKSYLTEQQIADHLLKKFVDDDSIEIEDLVEFGYIYLNFHEGDF